MTSLVIRILVVLISVVMLVMSILYFGAHWRSQEHWQAGYMVLWFTFFAQTSVVGLLAALTGHSVFKLISELLKGSK